MGVLWWAPDTPTARLGRHIPGRADSYNHRTPALRPPTSFYRHKYLRPKHKQIPASGSTIPTQHIVAISLNTEAYGVQMTNDCIHILPIAGSQNPCTICCEGQRRTEYTPATSTSWYCAGNMPHVRQGPIGEMFTMPAIQPSLGEKFVNCICRLEWPASVMTSHHGDSPRKN